MKTRISLLPSSSFMSSDLLIAMVAAINIFQLPIIQAEDIINPMYPKQPLRSSQVPLNKLTQTVNQIAKNKKHSDSDFRVHFTLMNVHWKIKEVAKEQKLIDYVFGVVNQFCRVHIVQIAAVIEDDVYDVSVGLENDLEAFEFLRKKMPVMLADGAKDNHENMPIISRVFQSFIKKMEKTKEDFVPVPPPVLNKPSSFTTVLPTRVDTRQQFVFPNQIQKRNSEPQLSIEKKKPLQATQIPKPQGEREREVPRIWAFGIPKQFTMAQVKQSLKKQGLQPGQCKWRNKQYMEYLDIELLTPISKSKIYYLGLQIDGFPFVIIPPVSELDITRELARYTVEIITRPSFDDEEKFIKSMADIGGVNIMVRTPVKERDDFRYLIVFNNVDKAEKACRVAKNLRDCIAQRKQYQLRVGRVNKFYTFTALIQELGQNRP